MSIASEFLSSDPKPNWIDNDNLIYLQDYLDVIRDVKIKAFVTYLLSKADCFWQAPVASFDDGSYPPDEYQPGGLIRNTRRAVRSFITLQAGIRFTSDEIDCGISALLLRNINKALWLDVERSNYGFDPFFLYTVDGFLNIVSQDTADQHEDNGRVLGIDDEIVSLILRLIRTSDGYMSIIPETIPVTPLEQMVHMATLMGRTCHVIFFEQETAASE